MESLFDKDPTAGPPLSNLDRIKGEIDHIKKGTSVREAPGARNKKLGRWVLILLILGFAGLYAMDPVIYAAKRSEAIDVYLYLHNYDSKSSTDALVASRILSEDDLYTLNRRTGSFQDYFASPQKAEARAAAIVAYVDSVKKLHANQYDQLDTLGKIRCVLFVRNGLPPPTYWTIFNPAVH